MDNYYIIVFQNTYNAIEGEKVIKEKGYNISMMPTPSNITQSCGISIRFKEEDLENIKSLIEGGNINIKHVYQRNENGFQEII